MNNTCALQHKAPMPAPQRKVWREGMTASLIARVGFPCFLALTCPGGYAGTGPLALARGDLPGEYRRSYDFSGSNGGQPGLKIILRADGSFEAEATGNVSATPQNEIREGISAKASGNWAKSNENEIKLMPTSASGVFKHHCTVFQIRSCGDQPALLASEDIAVSGSGRSAFPYLLLKERSPDEIEASKARHSGDLQLNWKELERSLLEKQPNALRRMIGNSVAFKGQRLNGPRSDGDVLLVKVGAIQCRVQNDMDGTRLASTWIAGMVGVEVEGTVLSVDSTTNIVEIRPNHAGMLWAR